MTTDPALATRDLSVVTVVEPASLPRSRQPARDHALPWSVRSAYAMGMAHGRRESNQEHARWRDSAIQTLEAIALHAESGRLAASEADLPAVLGTVTRQARRQVVELRSLVEDTPGVDPSAPALSAPRTPARTTAITVYIVEDHPLYLDALCRGLAADPDLEIAGVYGSLREFPFAVKGGVVVLDLDSVGPQGIQAVRYLVRQGFTPLLISDRAQREDVQGGMAAGARGYLCKRATIGQIVEAIQAVAGGQTYVSPTLASFALSGDRGARGASPHLTTREREVLILLAAGETDQSIADQLRLSVRTVRSYLERVREKTGRRRRADLTRYAIAEGLMLAGSTVEPG